LVKHEKDFAARQDEVAEDQRHDLHQTGHTLAECHHPLGTLANRFARVVSRMSDNATPVGATSLDTDDSGCYKYPACVSRVYQV
jgi:hypothetical protein